MTEIRTIEFPHEMAVRWPDILKMVAEIGSWAAGYSEGYISGARSDFPEDGPPNEVPLWEELSDDNSWSDWPHRKMYAVVRDWAERDVETPILEIHFGSFALFRVSKEDHAKLNAGYEDSAGTENERFIEDGDHMIVVYMM